MSQRPDSSVESARLLEWIEQLPDVASRLRREPPDRVLVLGCRDGTDALDLAGSFPNLTVYGIDSDVEAVRAAQQAGQRSPTRDRVLFLHDSETDPRLQMTFDLVVAVGLLTDPVRAAGGGAATTGVAQAVWLLARLVADGGLAMIDSPVPLTADLVSQAGFAHVSPVGTSRHGCPVYLLRR